MLYVKLQNAQIYFNKLTDPITSAVYKFINAPLDLVTDKIPVIQKMNDSFIEIINRNFEDIYQEI